MTDTIQDWGALKPSDPVTVAEPGRRPYAAVIDDKTADSGVVWVLSDAGVRRAFDAREAVEVRRRTDL